MVVSMDLYIQRKFSDYIAACESELEKKENSNTLSILCNIASAEYELELYRKCIKTCHRALALNQNFIRAHLLLLKSLLKLDKYDTCMTMCEDILSRGEGRFEMEDVNIILQVQDLMNSVKSRSQSENFVPSKGNLSSIGRSFEDVASSTTQHISDTGLNIDASMTNLASGSPVCSVNTNGNREEESSSSGRVNMETSKCNSNEPRNSKKTQVFSINEDVQHRLQDLQEHVDSPLLCDSPSHFDSSSPTGNVSPTTAKPTNLNPNLNSKRSKVKRVSIPAVIEVPLQAPTPTKVANASGKKVSSSAGKSPHNIPSSLPSKATSQHEVAPLRAASQNSVTQPEPLISGQEDTAKATKTSKSKLAAPTAVPIASTSTSTSTSTSVAIAGSPTDPISRLQLEEYLSNCLRNEDALVTRTLLKSVRSSLCCAHGEDIVDDMIAFGYLQVNTGKLDRAIAIFDTLLRYRTDLPAAHLGTGSAYALTGRYEDAVASFSRAINCDPTKADFWKRRGQTRVALGQNKGALADLTKAMSLSTDLDIIYQRGLVYYQMKNYRRALKDFCSAATGEFLRKAPLYNYIGMCEGQVGSSKLSIEAHLKALQIDPTFKEAQLNFAQIHKDLGHAVIADAAFLGAIALDTTNTWCQGHIYRAQLLHAMGRPKDALEELLTVVGRLPKGKQKIAPQPVPTKALEIDPASVSPSGDLAVISLTAVCYQSIGMFRSAVTYFSKALLVDQTSCCWYQREIALYIWSRLDRNLGLFNLDDDVDPRIKDGWCKRASWRHILPSSGSTTSSSPTNERYTPQLHPKSIRSIEDYPTVPSPCPTTCPSSSSSSSSSAATRTVTPEGTSSPNTVNTTNNNNNNSSNNNGNNTKMEDNCKLAPLFLSPTDPAVTQLLSFTAPYGAWMQLRCVGFLPNTRQHKMFGLASLQMAQRLQTHVNSVRLGGPGLQISDASASAKPLNVDTISTSTSSVSGGGKGRYNLHAAKTGGSSGSSSSSGGVVGCSAPSGTKISSDSPSTGKRMNEAYHTLAWRDFFDVIIKWRQISEPNDPVWWIDRLPLQAFLDGFSLQTPLVSGQLKTSRYYSYYRRAVGQLKKYLKKGYFTAQNVFETLSVDKINQLENMVTVDEILRIVGKDFYVVLPCPSIRYPGTVYEGTRLTLLDHPPEGFEFSIRTPGFPARWTQYENELDSIFQRLVDALSALKESTPPRSSTRFNPFSYKSMQMQIQLEKYPPSSDGKINPMSEDSAGSGSDDKDKEKEKTKEQSMEEMMNDVHLHSFDKRNPHSSNSSAVEDDYSLDSVNPSIAAARQLIASPPSDPDPSGLSSKHTEILKIALEMFYFWINFSPLTRGTAACGYSCLVATMLCCGLDFAEPLPLNMQLDWEAIFSPNCSDFVDRIAPLLPFKVAVTGIDCVPSVEDKVQTFRDMVQALL